MLPSLPHSDTRSSMRTLGQVSANLVGNHFHRKESQCKSASEPRQRKFSLSSVLQYSASRISWVVHHRPKNISGFTKCWNRLFYVEILSKMCWRISGVSQNVERDYFYVAFFVQKVLRNISGFTKCWNVVWMSHDVCKLCKKTPEISKMYCFKQIFCENCTKFQRRFFLMRKTRVTRLHHDAGQTTLPLWSH